MMQNPVDNNSCPPVYDHSNLETLLKQSRDVDCDELTEEEEGVVNFLNKLKFGKH